MRKKKDLPIVILKALEPYVNLKGDKFEVIEPKDNLLKVIDKDSDSNFYFTIEKYEKRNNSTNFQFLMKCSPKSTIDNGNYHTWVDIGSLSSQFNAWLKLLDEYESVNSFFDDPITKSFKEEFYAEFEIIDEDAETNPLNTKQILLIDNYLESIDTKLLEFRTEQNAQDIEEIKDDILTLRENLTNKSKKWVVTKLASIWAKIAKQGTKFMKEFLSESKKEIIKQSVKGVLDYVKDNGLDLLN